MARAIVRRQPQVIQPEQHHARCPLGTLQRCLPRQRKIRHPIFQLRPEIRPPRILRVHLPGERRDPPLGFQHFPGAAIHFPADIKGHLRLHAHWLLRSSPFFLLCFLCFLYLLDFLIARARLFATSVSRFRLPRRAARSASGTPTPSRARSGAAFPPTTAAAFPPRIRRAAPCAGGAIARRCWPPGSASCAPVPPASSTRRSVRRTAALPAESPAAFSTRAVAPANPAVSACLCLLRVHFPQFPDTNPSTEPTTHSISGRSSSLGPVGSFFSGISSTAVSSSFSSGSASQALRSGSS